MVAKKARKRAHSESSRIYLDYASATPTDPVALKAMHAIEKYFANPGSIHAEGVQARRVLESAREEIARELGCKSRQVVFTSGLSESNNLAILGYARKLQLSGASLSGTHWITSSIEHDSVLECFGEVERLGGTVTFVDPEPSGIVSTDSVARALRPNTVFVSVGWANNEIGTIQPLSKIARVIREHEKTNRTIAFHSDAGQGPLYLSPQVHTLGVDMFALGSGKLYGPRTIGALYIRDPQSIAPLMLGGGQEKGIRAGTEKLVPAVGLAKVLGSIAQRRKTEARRMRELRDTFARALSARIPGLKINGDMRHMLPHMLNVSIPGDRTGEYLVLQLDHAGISVSTKSACRSGEAKSHVVAAIAAHEGEEWRAVNTIRFSLGAATTKREIARVVEACARLFPD